MNRWKKNNGTDESDKVRLLRSIVAYRGGHSGVCALAPDPVGSKERKPACDGVAEHLYYYQRLLDIGEAQDYPTRRMA